MFKAYKWQDRTWWKVTFISVHWEHWLLVQCTCLVYWTKLDFMPIMLVQIMFWISSQIGNRHRRSSFFTPLARIFMFEMSLSDVKAIISSSWKIEARKKKIFAFSWNFFFISYHGSKLQSNVDNFMFDLLQKWGYIRLTDNVTFLHGFLPGPT